jgi:hypothetical protein
MSDQDPSCTLWLSLQNQEPLLLVHLGECRSFHRARIENGGVQGLPTQVFAEHLVTMDVPRQDGGELVGKVSAPDYIPGLPESVVRRTHGSPFHAVVDTKEAHLSLFRAPSGFLEYPLEVFPDPAPHIGETRKSHPVATNRHHFGPRSMEDVEVWVI